jgi:hypothetical protein
VGEEGEVVFTGQREPEEEGGEGEDHINGKTPSSVMFPMGLSLVRTCCLRGIWGGEGEKGDCR